MRRHDAKPLRLGTRCSRLARIQAQLVAVRLPQKVTIVPIAVDADSDPRGLEDLAGKRAFTGSIERHLQEGDIDVAVHSLKDLSVMPLSGLCVAARLPRGPVGDVLLCRADDNGTSLGLPEGARVGTGSPRRAALLARHAPQARAVPIRGNVPTRIEHCVRGSVDAVVLAQVGIERLGTEISTLLEELRSVPLDPPHWLPAPGQAAIALQAREDDEKLLAVLAEIDDTETGTAVDLERTLLQASGGGCQSSLGAYARPDGRTGWRADVGVLDGCGRWQERNASGNPQAIQEELVDWIHRESREGRHL